MRSDLRHLLHDVLVPLECVSCCLLLLVLLISRCSRQFSSFPAFLFLYICTLDVLTCAWKILQWSSEPDSPIDQELHPQNPQDAATLGCAAAAGTDKGGEAQQEEPRLLQDDSPASSLSPSLSHVP